VSEFLTVSQAARACPTPISPNSIWRWARRGVRPRRGNVVRLDHVRVGRRVMIPRDALNQFFVRVAQEDLAPPVADNSTRKVSAGSCEELTNSNYEAAMRELGLRR